MFFGLPYNPALCCAVCCGPLEFIGAYLGWAKCGGKVYLSRMPEILIGSAAIAAFDDETGLFTSWGKTDAIEAPDLTTGGVTYRCVGVAGSQTSDGSWQKVPNPDYVYYQLHYAPLDDLETTTPRAALAKIKIHEPTNTALQADPFNRQFDLIDCWFVNGSGGSPYYWDAAWKICNHWDEGAPVRRVCVGTDHFAIVERRYSGIANNRCTYWTTGVSTAIVTTWDNPETMTDTGGDKIVAAFDEHTFPQAIAIQSSITTESYGLASVTKTTQHGPANLGTMELQDAFIETRAGAGDTHNYQLTCSRTSVDGAALTTSNTSMMVNDFTAFGSFLSLDEYDFPVWEYGDPAEVSRYYFGGCSLMTLAASEDTSLDQRHFKTLLFADGTEPTPYRYFVFDHPLKDTTAPGIFAYSLTVDSDTLYSTTSIDTTERPAGDNATQTGKRLYGFPGNSRSGTGDTVLLNSVYTDAASNSGWYAPYAVYISDGYAHVTLSLQPASILIDGGLLPFGSVLAAQAKRLYENESAPLTYSHTQTRVLIAAHSHPGYAGSEGASSEPAISTPRGVRYAIHNFAMSLCPAPVVEGDITYEPDALEANPGAPQFGVQIEDSYDRALPLEEWNILAHPQLSEEAARELTTRWCYHWIGINKDLYPMVKIRNGVWEPRRPPMGVYWNGLGERVSVDSLAWDSSPDAKHPVAATWPL